MKPLRNILHTLNDVNYLTAKFIGENENMRYNISLLKNGLKLREQLIKQWKNTTSSWATQHGDIKETQISLKYNDRISLVQSVEFKKMFNQIYKPDHSLNPVVLRTIVNNSNNFANKDDIFFCPENTYLISEYFVATENGLSKYYNLQRERKIWWMRFSANSSRYFIEPFNFSSKDSIEDKICKNSKSITIKANFSFGAVDIEQITIVPVYEMCVLNQSCTENNLKVSLIRSVINLDFTTCALILDSFETGSKTGNNAMMLNRKLAPYQILLASTNRENIIDELIEHLQHVLRINGLRIYDKYLHVNCDSELETQLLYFDRLGVPYTLVVDDKSIKSGLIRIRNRDTTLLETIHITDIPSYILSIFKH